MAVVGIDGAVGRRGPWHRDCIWQLESSRICSSCSLDLWDDHNHSSVAVSERADDDTTMDWRRHQFCRDRVFGALTDQRRQPQDDTRECDQQRDCHRIRQEERHHTFENVLNRQIITNACNHKTVETDVGVIKQNSAIFTTNIPNQIAHIGPDIPNALSAALTYSPPFRAIIAG